jgi:hypothetical protein
MLNARTTLVAALIATVSPACTSDETLGTIGLNLAGQGPSGTVYVLRNADITITGGTEPLVFHTEDNPNATSITGHVTAGPYSASLADGWRLERIANGVAVQAPATLISPNPVSFEVLAGLTTSVQMRFRVDGTDVTLGEGDFDISLGVTERVSVGIRAPLESVGLNGGFLIGNPIEVPANATLVGLGHTSRATTSSVRYQLGLYRDVGNLPANLIAEVGPLTERTGIDDVAVPPVSLAPGTYWIMGLYETSIGEVSGVGLSFKRPEVARYVFAPLTPGSPLPPTFPTETTTSTTGVDFNQYILVDVTK